MGLVNSTRTVAFGAVVGATLAIEIASARGEVPFAGFQQYEAGANSTGLAAADFDGDGDLDLAVSNRDSGDVVVLRNNGSGEFGPPVSYPIGVQPRYVVAADLDDDGAPDLAVTDKEGSTVTVLRNLGGGAFEVHQVVEVFSPDWITTIDINGDGDLDLVIGEHSHPPRVSLLRNNGSALFFLGGMWDVPSGTRGGDVGDFDADGDPDLAIVNIAADSISILSNDGGGLTAPVTLPANDEPRYIAARDYDADGDIDLAVVHKRSNDLWLYRNDGTGGFTQALEDRFALNDAPHAVDAADLDLDGDCDLVVSHVGSDPFVRLMLNDGTGKFEPEVLFSPDGGAHVVAVDLDGDSDFDVATANTNNGTVNIHRNETVDAGGIMFLALVDQAGGPFEPGQEIEVELRMRDLAGQPVVAYQAFLEFTTTQLAFVEGVYTVEPMGLGIIDPIEAIGGKIDLAAGLLPGKQEPTTEDAALAVLTFRALSALCDPSVRFRPNTPPTRLSGVDGAPVEPLLLINLGSQSCPADINGDCDVGFADLLSMLTAWGPCEECPQDLDRSGDVGITDLLRVLASWGPCAA